MATFQTQTIEVPGIQDESEVITMSEGGAKVNVYTHGATNTLNAYGEQVTATRGLKTMLVEIDQLYRQRGGNPFFGPMAGRYDTSKLSQPGARDIHGVFGGMKWKKSEMDESEGYIELKLPANVWKTKVIDYYYFAAAEPKTLEQQDSLVRLVDVVANRYKNSPDVQEFIIELRRLLSNIQDLKMLKNYITSLVNLAFPGEANIVRRITIERTDNQVTSFLDEVTIENTSEDENVLDSSGYHSYINAFLEEIMNPRDFFQDGVIIQDFDDNLNEVRVAELDQRRRLNRRMFIAPEGMLKNKKRNSIIYRDPEMIGYPEVAIEYWYQPGDANHYPAKANIIKPGQNAKYAIRIIVVQGDEVPSEVSDYVNRVNAELGVRES